jgi:hypothetical protein
LTRPLSPGADVARSCADGAPKAKGAYGWCSSIFDLLSAGRSRKIRKIDAHFNSLPQQHRATACHIGTGTGLTPATSAPGLRSPLPHLHRDWAHPCHTSTGTALAPATSAPGLRSPLPHLHRDCAHRRNWIGLFCGWSSKKPGSHSSPQGT